MVNFRRVDPHDSFDYKAIKHGQHRKPEDLKPGHGLSNRDIASALAERIESRRGKSAKDVVAAQHWERRIKNEIRMADPSRAHRLAASESLADAINFDHNLDLSPTTHLLSGIEKRDIPHIEFSLIRLDECLAKLERPVMDYVTNGTVPEYLLSAETGGIQDRDIAGYIAGKIQANSFPSPNQSPAIFLREDLLRGLDAALKIKEIDLGSIAKLNPVKERIEAGLEAYLNLIREIFENEHSNFDPAIKNIISENPDLKASFVNLEPKVSTALLHDLHTIVRFKQQQYPNLSEQIKSTRDFVDNEAQYFARFTEKIQKLLGCQLTCDPVEYAQEQESQSRVA